MKPCNRFEMPTFAENNNPDGMLFGLGSFMDSYNYETLSRLVSVGEELREILNSDTPQPRQLVHEYNDVSKYKDAEEYLAFLLFDHEDEFSLADKVRLSRVIRALLDVVEDYTTGALVELGADELETVSDILLSAEEILQKIFDEYYADTPTFGVVSSGVFTFNDITCIIACTVEGVHINLRKKGKTVGNIIFGKDAKVFGASGDGPVVASSKYVETEVDNEFFESVLCGEERIG